MPSTLVHVGLAGLVGAALLADHFDARSILVVMAAVAFIDLDVFVGLVFPGTHRAAFHTLLLPLLLGALLYYDLHVRGRASENGRADESDRSGVGARWGKRKGSWIRARWGARGVRISWVSLVAVTLAGIAPDLFFNGVNLFYPVQDRFYDLSGHLIYSDQRGFVQTFVDFELRTSDPEQVRTTENTHYKTGVDPSRDPEPENVERIFYIFTSGERLLLALTGYSVVAMRLWTERRN